MSATHSFFLPSASATDSHIEPLLSYLSLLIYSYHECIYCQREKNSVHSVQSHMRDAAHCKLDGSLYEDFFFSSSEDNEAQEDDIESQEEEETTEKQREEKIHSRTSLDPSFPKELHKEKSKQGKTHQQYAQPKVSLQQRQQRVVSATTITTTPPSPQNSLRPFSSSSSSSSSSPSPHTPPLPLLPVPQPSRNSALSLAGLSTAQLLSLATLDKKMRRQQVTAQKRVGHRALRQPVKAMYYKTENPVYQAG
jgi:pre-60S factor REI1